MSQGDDVSFLDIVCVLHITPETTLEKFGSVINASVFDAANIAGSLKQKGLINFNSRFPGPTGIEQTDACRALISNADARSMEGIDSFDEEILSQLSGGKRVPVELQSTMNVAQKDLALRLYKLYKQGYITYELRNGNVELLLTEQGFLKAKTPVVQAPQPSAAAEQSAAAKQGVATAAAYAAGKEAGADQTNLNAKIKGLGFAPLFAAIAVVVIVLLATLFLAGMI